MNAEPATPEPGEVEADFARWVAARIIAQAVADARKPNKTILRHGLCFEKYRYKTGHYKTKQSYGFASRRWEMTESWRSAVAFFLDPDSGLDFWAGSLGLDPDAIRAKIVQEIPDRVGQDWRRYL